MISSVYTFARFEANFLVSIDIEEPDIWVKFPHIFKLFVLWI